MMTMVIKFTYLDVAGFDVDYFDYSYSSDTSPDDVLNDFDNILLEHGDVFTLTEQEETRDGAGAITAISEVTYSIYGYIQDLTKKDRKLHESGIAIKGDRLLYLKPTYVYSGTTYTPKEGVILTDRDSVKWRLVQIIQEPYFANVQIYKKCLVRSINLEGSE